MSVRTLLIGVDGATYTVLDPLMEAGIMPRLAALVAGGARAELRTIVPALTPPAWTSLMTGRRPGHHGIFDFFQRSAEDSAKIEFATHKDVRVKTIWRLANENSLSATVLNFPLMFPAPALNGHVVAGWLPWRQLRLGCHPAELFKQLKSLPGFNVRELAMDMALEAKATEGADSEEYAAWVQLHTRREEQWLMVAEHLLETEPSDLFAVLFDGPDKIGHLLWRYIDPGLWPDEPDEESRHIRALCHAYFGRLDEAIGRLVDLAGPDATVLIASDHGFGATTEVFHINTWLAEKGYLSWRPDFELSDDSGTLGMGHLSRHVQWFDWDRTLAYASTPTSNGIHIVAAREEGGPGVPPDAYESFRERLIADLRAFRDPQSGEPIITEIHTREEAFAGTAMSLAPDLTLVLRDGGLVSILPGDASLVARPRPEGTHRPLGVFIAAGPGIRAGASVPELSILDVAPAALYSLGLDVPADFEGRVPTEILTPERLAAQPVTIGAATTGSDTSVEDAAGKLDEESESALLARLMELGYLD